MEFSGMPLNWSDYYFDGFCQICSHFHLCLSTEKLKESVEILKSYNPRICGRVKEISAETLFIAATKNWNVNLDISKAIEVFFEGFKLHPIIYEYSVPVLEKLKADGHKICCFTDLPSAMPDSIFKPSINELLPYFDLYMSSEISGFRKPDKTGLELIARHFNQNVRNLIFIGDEQKDVKAAENAGCSFIHIRDFIASAGFEYKA